MLIGFDGFCSQDELVHAMHTNVRGEAQVLQPNPSFFPFLTSAQSSTQQETLTAIGKFPVICKLSKKKRNVTRTV